MLVIGVATGILFAVVGVLEHRLERSPDPRALSTFGPELAVFVVATLILFGLYLALLVMCAKRGLPAHSERVLAIAFPVVFNLVFVFVPPNLSTDLLSYISHGYIATTLNGNPLVEPSRIVADTPFGSELLRHGWRPEHGPSPYGPVWTYIEAAIVRASEGFERQMVGLKLVVAVASLGSALLIWTILAHVRPERRLLGTLAYLWNPMIVIEVAKEGHNDSVMVFFVLLALLLTIRGRGSGGFVAMSLGVLTKYLPLLLVPLQAAYLWRARSTTRRFARQVAVGVAVAAALGSVLFAGLWEGTETWAEIREFAQPGSPGFTGSTRSMAALVASRFVSNASAKAVVDIALILSFAVFMGVSAWLVRGSEELLRACAGVGVVYLLLVSPSYWPWYAVLPVALLAVVASDTALLVLLGLSVGARLAAPLQILSFHGVLDWKVYLVLTWLLGVGLAVVVGVMSRWNRWSPFAPGVAFEEAASPMMRVQR